MVEHRYTVSEIDALRRECERRYLTDGKQLHARFGINSAQMHTQVEDQVRTYMLAGVAAADIHAADFPASDPEEEKTR